MGNIAIAYPNRLLELKTLHNCKWTDNPISPLSNITTPILSETARTSDFATMTDKRASFGLSLNNIPYRTLGAVGIINHNLSISAQIRITVFNEPPIAYANAGLQIAQPAGTSRTITLNQPCTIASGTKLKFYVCSNNSAHLKTDDWFKATVTSCTGTTLVFTYDGVNSPNPEAGTFLLWYIGYGQQSGKTESQLLTSSEWRKVWRRMYPSNSPTAIWRSTTLWQGVIEEEQRQSFTKIHISFLKDLTSGNQPIGSHVHIDLNDSLETTGDKFIEIGRVFIGQYTQPRINPEYGSVEHNFTDPSEISTTNSGTEYMYEKQKARTVSVQWSHMDEDEAFGGIYEASRSQGITREVLYAYDVEDTGAYQYARSFIGRFTQLNPITQPRFGLYGASINIKEIL